MTNPVPLTDLQKALDNLIARDVPQPLGPDDITVARLKERAGCNHKTALALIRKWLDAGDVEYLGMRRNGSRTVEAWRVKPQTPPSVQK